MRKGADMPKNNNPAETEVQNTETKEEVIDTRKPVIVNVPRIPGKPNYVVVWVNEENWKIMRGVDVEVPYCVADVLRQSAAAEAYEFAYREKL